MTIARISNGDHDPLREHAAKLYVQRRERDMAFSPDEDLFGEPAWDLMLDLFVRPLGREVAKIKPGGGWTTQERFILLLEDRGLIERSPGRSVDRECVTLTRKADGILRAHFAHRIAAEGSSGYIR